jgi:hypothetical protein
MSVSDGQMAASAWLGLWKITGSAEIEKIRNNLLEYCKLDTLGMVRILYMLKALLYLLIPFKKAGDKTYLIFAL